MTDLARLDPEHRRRSERLLRDRARRLAVLKQHASYWPRTFAPVGPLTRAMDDEGAAGRAPGGRAPRY